jgi:hypothetical protein
MIIYPMTKYNLYKRQEQQNMPKIIEEPNM